MHPLRYSSFFTIFGAGNACLLKSFVFTYILLFFCLTARTQTAFEQQIALSDSLSAADPREKLFVHYDKPLYQLKDTLWLKGYLNTSAEHLPNDSSRIVHVEIIDADKKIVKRINPVCYWGLFSSYIVLNEAEYSQGAYLLRAYTRRMQNFGDSLFFLSRFTIADPASPGWQVRFEKLVYDDNRLSMTAFFTAADTRGKADPVSVRLLSANKTIFRWSGVPDPLGKLYLDSAVGSRENDPLEIEITNKSGLQLRLPVPVSYGKPDLLFLPEGGVLLEGRQQKLAFKVLDPLGKPLTVKGIITDDRGATITSFETQHEGMGTLLLQPVPGRTYTARLDNGYDFPLPPAASRGYMLQVDNLPDTIRLRVDATPGYEDRLFYFTAATRGVVRAWGRLRKKEDAVVVKLDKKQFPSGVTVFTLYNEQLLPVNERAVFIWHDDALRLTAETHKSAYRLRDSVHLVLNATDGAGQPVQGSFSITVIDTSQVPVNELQENLLSYMLLSADLRGIVKNPYQYFNDSAGVTADLLMLTQGWVSYRQPPVHRPFAYEKDFTITGRVTNVFNKPVSGTGITLFGRAGKSGMFLMDTTTSETGQFSFNNFPVFETDSVSMVIKAVNRRGRAFNVGIGLDEPAYPAYTGNIPLTRGAAMLTDSAVKAYTAHQQELIAGFKRDGTYLEEVVVTGRARIAGSKNLNADGGSDQVINEAALDKTPKESLVDVLHQQVKGFRVGAPPKSSRQRYMVNSNIARFIIDGVDLEFFYQQDTEQSTMDYLLFYKGILGYFSAEDIKGIEVMNTPRYNTVYRNRFLSIGELMSSGPATIDYSFIEISTHSGAGPFMKKTPGMYLMKPVYPFIAKKFYSPRYQSPGDRPVFPDHRTTVYWNADVVTDSMGKAYVSFYTSESKGNYMMIIQGTDLKGRFGVHYAPLFILPEEEASP